MEHDVGSVHKFHKKLLVIQAANVQMEPVGIADGVQIDHLPGGDIVQDVDFDALAQQPLGKVRTDESGSARDEGALHLPALSSAKFRKEVHTAAPRPATGPYARTLGTTDRPGRAGQV